MVDSSVPLDDLYIALTDRDRRRLLFALLDHNPQEEVSIPGDIELGERDRKSFRVEMFHKHLPMLEEMGFIEWDRPNHQVVKGHELTTIRPVLEQLREYHEDYNVCQ